MQISVITPFYHGQKYVEELLQLMTAMAADFHGSTGGSLEFIMVNDSPQQPLQLPSPWDREEMPALSVKVLESPCNGGIHAARVRGLSEAEGEYVLFLDQDDSLQKNCMSFFYKALQKTEHDPIDLVVCNGYRVRSGGTDRKQDRSRTPLYRTPAAQQLVHSEHAYLYGTDMIFSPGQCLIRKEAIPAAWRTSLMKYNGCDDFYLWLLLLNRNCRILTVAQHLYEHREHRENVSNSFSAMSASYLEMCDLLKQNGYPENKLAVLQKRWKIRQMKREKKGLMGRICVAFALLVHPAIAWATFEYKRKGYY